MTTSPEEAPHTAQKLLADARTRRWTIPADQFPGFQADIIFQDDARRLAGTVRLISPGDMTFNIAGLNDASWLKDELATAISHRLSTPKDQSGALNQPVRLEEDLENALGQKIMFEGDPMGSSYRIRDGMITEVSRRMPSVSFTITTLESTTLPDGRMVPKHYVVVFRDPQNGNIVSVAQHTESYTMVEGICLPCSLRVIESFANQTAVHTVELSNITLLK